MFVLLICFVRGKDHLYFQERGKPHSVISNAEVGNLQEKSDEADAHIPSASVDLLSGRIQRKIFLKDVLLHLYEITTKRL